ncbi:MAG: DUF2892 domain-containing protein [Gammaproteobacteria bacterium]|nr:DUF2892 domain-containing protein [Gammaproteobacteria bacterium]
MKQNMGGLDRMLRVIVALVIGGLYFGKVISGTLAIVLGVLAVVFLGTSAIGFCPLYPPLGINTKGDKT